MTSVEQGVFQCHPLRILEITNAYLTSPVPLTQIKSTLVELNFMTNSIVYIPKHYFYGCRILRKVWFNNNRLFVLPDLGYIAKTIYYLNFEENCVKSVDKLQNVTFPILEHLYIGFNLISSFDIRSISRMSSLANLAIQQNNITQLQNPENFVISKINQLHVGTNPWHCGTNLAWMLKWDHTENYYASVRAVFTNFRIMDMEDVKCHTPNNLKGMKLMYIGKKTYQHPEST